MKRFDRSVRAARPSAGARQKPRAATASPFQEQTLRITEIGARGHGIASGALGPIYVPFTLPGEEIQAKVLGDRGEALVITDASPERIAAECSVFGQCGGCQVQHWAQPPYLAWKEGIVRQALARRGLDVRLEPIIAAWGIGRRRAAFHAARQGRSIAFGFVRSDATGIEPMPDCPLLSPSLQSKIPVLENLATLLVPEKGELILQCLETLAGLDVNVRGAGQAPLVGARVARTTAAVLSAEIARISFEGEVFLVPQHPLIQIGLARVVPPPGAFLQATEAGEAAIARLVLEALAGAGRFADLFCGMGTFALRLAEHDDVLAVEADAPMLLALRGGADGAAGSLREITILRRDLLRNPLSALELKRIDAVVLDPPRSGARLQAEQIVASKVGRVAYVSCDAVTFARDARVMIDGGFRLTKLTPVDQFRWSPHIELVGAFER